MIAPAISVSEFDMYRTRENEPACVCDYCDTPNNCDGCLQRVCEGDDDLAFEYRRDEA